ncbi:MAG: TetR/AcrR family transcriptional regulator [Sporichthyaceae bacterium]
MNVSSVVSTLTGRVFERGPETEVLDDSTSDRILVAALRQFELFGVARSTVEQITKRSGLSRVTIYRRFPGKQNLVEAVLLKEVRAFLDALDARIADLPTQEEKLTEGFVFTLEVFANHTLLNRLLESEPESVLPMFTTEGGPVVAAARDYLAALLAKEFPGDGRDPAELSVVAELVVRLMLSFALTPQTAAALDDPDDARAFALRYLAPLLSGGQR